ncbi:hypothetical protein [Sedimentitalea todarodis]|uniref:DUF202 domain-containing protein n=1 Tax=Sedimentitalea todarodis TaxID=1631240 RepID=A0ABU3VEF2_9RHOB|nr:hypothetical protein [Sedimentitalea todarodis]MDU9004552.1 hypothetical protein [Sedimentitalea todarodis]
MDTDKQSEGLPAFDADFALVEYSELRSLVTNYGRAIAETERYAVTGAAALAAFAASELGDGLADARQLIAAIPAILLVLAGLRCMTIYWVLKEALRHVRRLEENLVSHPKIGFQRQYRGRWNRINRPIELIMVAYWVIAIGAAVMFWFALAT